MLRTETVSLHNEYKKTQYNQIIKQLNEANIRIFSGMWKWGPRNLLEVSRRIGMPFTSVYHRISRIESKSEEIAFAVPSVSKLGLIRVTILVTAAPGYEEEVTRALKAPNIWRSIGYCEGPFTHISIHLVPVKYLREFRSYIQEMTDKKIITNVRVIYSGDFVPNFPDFDYYSPKRSEWKFDWDEWLAFLREKSTGVAIEDPDSYCIAADKKDMMIIRELQYDARKSFVDIATATGMTPNAVKYHFDKITACGVAARYMLRVVPYPIEISAYHKIMLEFTSKEDLERFVSLVPKLFFIVGMEKVLRQNTIMVETWMLQSRLQDMFSFFSHMAIAGLLKSHSSVRMDFKSRQVQTISDELFDDEKGWVVDFEKCSSELPRVEKLEITS